VRFHEIAMRSYRLDLFDDGAIVSRKAHIVPGLIEGKRVFGPFAPPARVERRAWTAAVAVTAPGQKREDEHRDRRLFHRVRLPRN
jgi:hypothetical protein